MLITKCGGLYNYRPQTKLREGNVFMDTCLFTRGWVFLMPCPFFGGYLWYQVPSRMGGYVVGLGGYVGGGYVQGGGYLPLPLDMGPGIAQDTVGKRAVRILLECFLVAIAFKIIASNASDIFVLSRLSNVIHRCHVLGGLDVWILTSSRNKNTEKKSKYCFLEPSWNCEESSVA